jgi:hypothetical protein
MKDSPLPQTDAQRYALLLDWGTRIGLVMLVLSFTAYVTGVLTPHVPLERLPSLWGLPTDTFHQLTHTPEQLDWVALITHGDRINMVGIAVLASCALPPLLALIPLFLQQRNGIIYALICGLEVAVLVLAASGVLSTGH